MLTLDIAIVTRNRAQVLDLSLPLLLKQSRKPDNIIIVDSSDDPEAVPAVVQKYLSATDIPITFFRSPAGMTIQRNIALQHVTSDIVMFPDDDSLLLPGALEAIMRIYEADVDERIGGVCGREALEAPAAVLSVARKRYRMNRVDRIKKLIARQRFLLERRFCPDPMTLFGRSRCNALGTLDWLSEKNAVAVEYMTGFRMSFRTRLIAQHGFDETLGRYALFEDVDASYSIMKTHLVVSAWDARVYHYRSPERRDAGLMLGVMQVLNRAYVVCRHAEPGANARRSLQRYTLYKMGIYMTEAQSKFGRDRLIGAFRAYRCLPALLKATPENLTDTYLQLREYCLNGTKSLVPFPSLAGMQEAIDLEPETRPAMPNSEGG
jgi:glycosyltransferase involved in cell wall biosynthesis